MMLVRLLVLSLAIVLSASAEKPQKEGGCDDFMDDLWSLPKLYQNKANPWVQEISLTGLYIGQYYAVEGNGGDKSDGWEDRRVRWGLRARVLQDFYVRAEAFSDPENDEVYAGLWNLSVAWKPSKAFNLMVGKFRPRWSLEGEDSCFDSDTIERSMLADLARPSNLAGLAVAGEKGRWSYYAGVFSAADGRTFGNFDGGALAAMSVGYDVTSVFGVKSAEVRCDYLFGETDAHSTGKGPWKHNLAVSLDLQGKRWGLMTEAFGLAGGAASAVGGTIEPNYWVTPQFQLVARYHIAASEGDSLRQQDRYERTLESMDDGGHGHFYQSAYLGVNWLAKPHRLKLMTGVEWANMDGGADGGGFHGWTWLSSVRVQF